MAHRIHGFPVSVSSALYHLLAQNELEALKYNPARVPSIGKYSLLGKYGFCFDGFRGRNAARFSSWLWFSSVLLL